MTLEEFKSLRDLQDKRVRMIFEDGEEIVATLVSISTDMDDSRHVIYEKVESSPSLSPDITCYSKGEDLVSCSLIEA